MIPLLAILVGFGAGWLTGGRVRNLEHLEFRYGWVILALFGLQAVLRSSHALTAWIHGSAIVAVWCACVAALIALAIANRQTTGMMIVALGLFLNLLVVLLNLGMPLSGSAAGSLGALHDAVQSVNAGFYRLTTAETHLALLGDVIPVPGPPGIRSIVSIGDILLLIGAAVVVAAGMRAKPVDEPICTDGSH